MEVFLLSATVLHCWLDTVILHSKSQSQEFNMQLPSFLPENLRNPENRRVVYRLFYPINLNIEKDNWKWQLKTGHIFVVFGKSENHFITRNVPWTEVESLVLFVYLRQDKESEKMCLQRAIQNELKIQVRGQYRE